MRKENLLAEIERLRERIAQLEAKKSPRTFWRLSVNEQPALAIRQFRRRPDGSGTAAFVTVPLDELRQALENYQNLPEYRPQQQ